MDPLTIVMATFMLSSFLAYRAINKSIQVYENEIPDFVDRMEAPNVKKALSNTDVDQIESQMGERSLMAIVFVVAALLASAINMIVILNIEHFNLFLQVLFAVSNAFVFVKCNHAHNTHKFMRACENRILAMVMQDKATTHAGEDSKGPKQDMLDWLDHEQDDLEQEMRENGEWPPKDDSEE